MTEPEKWYRYPGSNNVILPKERIPKFFADFDKFKKRIERIDFTDMLQTVIENKIMVNTKVLMVDEFQDLDASDVPNIWDMECKRWTDHCSRWSISITIRFWGGSPDFFDNWVADEIVILPHSHRLPLQIKDYSHKVLRMQGMKAPSVTAKYGYGNCITKMRYSEKLSCTWYRVTSN